MILIRKTKIIAGKALRFPKYFLRFLGDFIIFKSRDRKQKKIIRSIKNKSKIKVAFQLIHASAWKCDVLYELLIKDPHFDPFVVICPHFPCSEHEREKEYQRCIDLCVDKNYQYVITRRNGTYLSLEALFHGDHPDVVFIQNAWERTLPQYQISAWSQSLVCYIPYFFTLNILFKSNYSKLFHSLLWVYFVESDWHRNQSIKYSRFNMNNAVALGYPGLDRFLLPKETKKDSWPDSTAHVTAKKRVIYAPHHTISTSDAGLAYSTFEKFGLTIQSKARELKEQFSFVFKPHPLLFDKLCDHPEWGKERAQRYWDDWESISGTPVVEGDYTDLFHDSDCLVHDCNSFLAEYLATGKPCLFLMNDEHIPERINEFGGHLLSAHYKAFVEDDIWGFLESVLLNKSDPMSDERRSARENYLTPPNGKSASENIAEFLTESLR